MFGTQAPVTVRTAVPCDDCEATGAAPGTSPTTCPECGGAGQVRRVRQSILGQMVTAGAVPPLRRHRHRSSTSPCPACRGEGRAHRGAAPTPSTSPPASTPARRCGSPAAARSGPAAARVGDLYVHVRVRPHDRFARHGYDLVHELHLSDHPGRARRATSTFETLDGAEDLVVPRGTQTGRVVPAARPGRAPRRGPRPRRPARAGRGRHARPTSPTSRRTLLRQFAELRGEEVAPPDSGLARQDPLRVQVDRCSRSGAVPDGRGRSARLRRRPRRARADRRRPPPPRPRAARCAPATPLTVSDGAGRWRPCRFGDVARAASATIVGRPPPDAAADRRLRAGEGRPARARRAEAHRARRRPRSCRSSAARSVVRWDDGRAGRQRRAAASGSPARRPCRAAACCAARGRPTSTTFDGGGRRCPARSLAERDGRPPESGHPTRPRRPRGRLDRRRARARPADRVGLGAARCCEPRPRRSPVAAVLAALRAGLGGPGRGIER